MRLFAAVVRMAKVSKLSPSAVFQDSQMPVKVSGELSRMVT